MILYWLYFYEDKVSYKGLQFCGISVPHTSKVASAVCIEHAKYLQYVLLRFHLHLAYMFG